MLASVPLAIERFLKLKPAISFRLVSVDTTLGLVRCTVIYPFPPCKHMELLFYPKPGTRSRRALTRRFRQTHRGQQPHTYRPKGTLLTRLAHESGMTVEQVWAQLGKEWEYLLNQESKV
jgi:hypothetical protein